MVFRTIRDRLGTLPQVGRVEAVLLRPAHRAPVERRASTWARAGQGLEGDRQRGSGRRQVTLLQAEHLDVVASLLGLPAGAVGPEALRRNLVVRGVNLLALRQSRFLVGAALLEGTGTCDPCSRIEEALGPGGFNALRGHGGITARVLASGLIEVGAEVRLAPPDPGASAQGELL